MRPDLLAGEDLPRAPVQKRSRAKRERLKSAALAVFGESGYERASIETIAARAGLAVGGFYLHFRSKRQLLLALMDELLERLHNLKLRLESGGNPRERLQGLLERAFAADMEYLPAYRAWQEAVLSDAELARLENAIHAWTTARVLAVFDALRQMPGARAEVDAGALATAMDAFFWSLLGRAITMEKRELDQWIATATHLIYHALFRDV